MCEPKVGPRYEDHSCKHPSQIRYPEYYGTFKKHNNRVKSPYKPLISNLRKL